MRAPYAIALLLSISAMSGPAGAERWTYYTLSHGLPGATVRAFVQVQDGSVWAATNAGIARLNRSVPNARWQVISSKTFNRLAVATDGVIWAAGPNGTIQRFDVQGKELPTHLALPTEDIAALEAGSNGAIWIGQGGWLRRWSAEAGLEKWSLGNRKIYDIENTASGNLWLGAGPSTIEATRNLGFFSDGSVIFEPVWLPDEDRPGNPFNPNQQTVTALMTISDDEVVFGTAAGRAYHYSRPLCSSDPNQCFSDTLSLGGTPNFIEDLILDSLGRVWVAKKIAHVFDVNGQFRPTSLWTKSVIDAERGLNGDMLHAIFESNSFALQGTAMAPIGTREMWFGNEIGVSVQGGFPWLHFRHEDGELAGSAPTIQPCQNECNQVTEIALDPGRDFVWFGARSRLSCLRNGNAWTPYWEENDPMSGDLVHSQIEALHVDDDGGLWVASRTGFQYLSSKSSAWMTLGRNAPRWTIKDVTRDTQGFLWVAAQNGAWRFDTSTQPFADTLFAEVSSLAPLDALAASDDHMFVASGRGVGRYTLSSEAWDILPMSELPVPAPPVIREMIVVGDSLYAATEKGLLVSSVNATTLADAVLVSASSAVEGGFATNVLAVADAGQRTLFVGTDSGLYRLDRDLQRSGRLGVADGLPDEVITAVAVREDEVWIGTSGVGAAAHRFEAPETALLQPPPRVVVSSVNPVVFVAAAADLDTPPEFLSFEFRVNGGAWQPRPPQPRLPGPNLSFVPAEFMLDDGAHTLEVRAVDNSLLADQTPEAEPFELDTSPPMPRISFPAEGTAVNGMVQILGTADDPEDERFQRYVVTVRPTTGEAAPIQLVASERSVTDSVVATWNTNTRDTEDDWYTVEIVVHDENGVQGAAGVEVLVDNVAPASDVTSPVRMRGSEGGVVYSVKGRARLQVSPFGMDGDNEVKLDRTEVADPNVEWAFVVGPPGLALTKPATLELQIPPSLEKSHGGDRLRELTAQRDAITIQHQNPDGTWIELGGTRENRGAMSFLSCAIDRPGVYAVRASEAAPSGRNVITSMTTEPRHFRPRTSGIDRMSVHFVLGRPTSVSARVYSRSGRPRRTLAQGLQMGSGRQVIYWDGRDEEGNLVASALYVICVEAAGERVTKVVTVGSD